MLRVTSLTSPVKEAACEVDVEGVRKGVAAVGFVESPWSRGARGSASVKVRRELFVK